MNIPQGDAGCPNLLPNWLEVIQTPHFYRDNRFFQILTDSAFAISLPCCKIHLLHSEDSGVMLLSNSEAASCPFSLFLFLAVYQVIKQPSELGLEKFPCRAQLLFESSGQSGGDEVMIKVSPPGSSPGAPTHPSGGTTKGSSLDLSGRFCSHGSEVGAGILSRPSVPRGDRPGQCSRVISASWPCCIPLHPCQGLGKAWNSAIPISLSPPC